VQRKRADLKLGNRIVHFEIPATDIERLSKFYSDLFDWKIARSAMPGMDYWMIETTGVGPEHVTGGIYSKQGETDRPRLYVGVENIDAHTERLKQAGGSIIVEKQEIPQMGWSVLASDPENNLIALFQPIQPPPAPKKAPAKKVQTKKKKAKPVKKKSKKKK
jgi:uncharacterized protein